MAFKLTPKSCSCRQCTFSKRGTGGNFMMKKEERAHRHRSDQLLRTYAEDADLEICGRRQYVG